MNAQNSSSASADAHSAEQLLAHHDAGSYWPCSVELPLDAAYQRQLQVRALRVARGEQPRGFKIGFTNRGIWPRYQVFAPIWGTVYDSSLQLCEGEGTVDLQATREPRLEPEAVFGLRSTPPRELTLQSLFESIEWVAPGFEVVQSHRPDWRFASASDPVADGSLHARLLVGRRVSVRDLAADGEALEALLAAAEVTLCKADQPMESGRGAAVLDGPLHALLHFAQELRRCPGAPDLQGGDVVTTGTWTDAWPVAPGEQWQARFSAPLSALTVRFV